MTIKELRDIKQLINAAQIDCGCLTIEEVDHLAQVIETEIYVQQIKDFKRHLDKMLEKLDGTEEEQDAFYDLKWSISFAGKTVDFDNCADIFNDMQALVSNYIENDL